MDLVKLFSVQEVENKGKTEAQPIMLCQFVIHS